MDFSLNSWSDIATFGAAMAVVLGFVGWLAKTWIEKAVAKMGDEIKPHLTNDDTSVAKYAHQARDAALEAKSAALDAKSAAVSASAAADHISVVVEKIDQRLREKE